MSFWELLLIALGLSMDAFAVAICKGLCMPKLDAKNMIKIAAFFGLFQAMMPLIGWFMGKQFAGAVSRYDHWIAFGLLSIIGGKMIWEAFHKGETDDVCVRLSLRELLVLSIATSIDALAVGITFAFLEVPIGECVILIGVTTFLLSAVGVYIGHRFGNRFEKKAEFAGGLVLVMIGIKILLEHLGFLA